MSAQEPSLGYILPLFSQFSPAQLLQTEIAILKKVIADILKEINKREHLEDKLLSALEQQVMHLHTELIREDRLYIGLSQQTTALEQSLGAVEIQKIHTREKTAGDILDLKKLLWHYWLLLQRKEAQLYILR